MGADTLTWIREASTVQPKPPQTRRSHRKSRRGCLICKKRRIKCDEAHPACGPCTASSKKCEFSPTKGSTREGDGKTCEESAQSEECITDLPTWPTTASMSFESTLGVHVFATAIARVTNASAQNGTSPNSLTHILRHFEQTGYKTLTSYTGQQILHDEVPSMLTSHPFLMHTVLAFSASHLQYLASKHKTFSINTAYDPLTLTAHYHTQRALNLYGERIQSYRSADHFTLAPPSETDALLAACIMLTSLFYHNNIDPQFSLRQCTSATTSWIITNPTTLDLGVEPSSCYNPRNINHFIDWLTNVTGVSTLLQLPHFQQNMGRSMWLPFFLEANHEHARRAAAGRQQCQLPCLHTFVYNSPKVLIYDPVLTAIQSLLSLEPTDLSNFGLLISLPGRFPPQFINLVHQQDTVAVLLLGHWFGMIERVPHWWCRERGQAEAEAVLAFLERAVVRWKGEGQESWDRVERLERAVKEFRCSRARL